MMAKVYRATAERDGDWWLVRVPDVPQAYTQVRRLDQAEPMAREVISLLTDVPERDIAVHVDAVLDEEAASLLRDLKDARAAETAARDRVEQLTGRAASTLIDRRLTVRDAGKLMELSFQRVHQLASPKIRMAGAKALRKSTAARGSTGTSTS